MNKEKLWNYFELANDETERGKKIFIPYGRWPWNDRIDQVFDKEHAEKIAADLSAKVEAGEPGLPVYQGHPDVPELAAKYPDKGALGWIKKIDVFDRSCMLTVEWDRWPGKGFGWFSPYWLGPAEVVNGKIVVTVEEIRSVGLVNRPNIRAFRLPNEELGTNKTEEQIMKDILRALGLPETATAEEAIGAIGKLKGEAEACAADKAKAEADKVALDDECKKQKCCNEELQKKVEEQTKALANSAKELEEAKTALANEQAEVKKLKSLKTASVTTALSNETHNTDNRLALVNEIMQKQKLDFDAAWCLAKSQKPDLFK